MTCVLLQWKLVKWVLNVYNYNINYIIYTSLVYYPYKNVDVKRPQKRGGSRLSKKGGCKIGLDTMRFGYTAKTALYFCSVCCMKLYIQKT